VTTQIFLAATLYGTATIPAALDSDCFAPAGRRILLVSNNAATPETTPAADEMPGFERLRGRFDDVISWNETISPFHPAGWQPRTDEALLWERHLRLAWNLGDDDIELAVESIQVHPALGIAQIFTDAPVTVYADGLMSYGPTRNKIDPLRGRQRGLRSPRSPAAVARRAVRRLSQRSSLFGQCGVDGLRRCPPESRSEGGGAWQGHTRHPMRSSHHCF
jgi:hypothetical protein